MSPERYLRGHGFFRLPLPVRLKLPFLRAVKFREQYYARGAGRLSGWLVQQIVKMSAPDFSDASLFVFADSDVVLVRPFSLDVLTIDGKLHLQQHPRGEHLHRHAGWRLNAHKLLGIKDAGLDPRHNYIGNVIPWKRDTLLEMTGRIEKETGKNWRIAVAEAKEVSEYILYGEFVTHCLGEASGHLARDRKLYNSVWSPDERIDTDAILAAMEPQHVALHIQSTNPVPLEARRAAIASVRARLDPMPARPAS